MAGPDLTTLAVPTRSAEETETDMDWIDAAMGTAGHHIDDPDARAILRRQMADEIDGDQARRLLVLDAIQKAQA